MSLADTPPAASSRHPFSSQQGRGTSWLERIQGVPHQEGVGVFAESKASRGRSFWP